LKRVLFLLFFIGNIPTKQNLTLNLVHLSVRYRNKPPEQRQFPKQYFTNQDVMCLWLLLPCYTASNEYVKITEKIACMNVWYALANT